ncbi:MAG: hypothetical protein WC140_04025 [Bacteroidales bacterium]
MDEQKIPALNNHNKKEYPPAHTAEHILNRTMVNKFKCSRSRNTHIEKKKSKCDYLLKTAPNETEIKEIEAKVNEVINSNLDINMKYVTREEASKIVDLSKLPENASKTLRIVSIGDYDDCACIGEHVKNTSEIGEFKIISNSFIKPEKANTLDKRTSDVLGKWRVRWKLL